MIRLMWLDVGQNGQNNRIVSITGHVAYSYSQRITVFYLLTYYQNNLYYPVEVATGTS